MSIPSLPSSETVKGPRTLDIGSLIKWVLDLGGGQCDGEEGEGAEYYLHWLKVFFLNMRKH